MRYVYSEIAKTKNNSSIFRFCNDSRKFVLKENFSFHLFTTHAPCGDASIFAISNETDGNSEIPVKRRKVVEKRVEDNESGYILPRSDEHSDQNNEVAGNFTGAKIILNNFDVPQDLMSQDIGRLRTKPGRGVCTLSMSCSDKLARWNAIGLQGALLSILIDRPIYLSSITFDKTSGYCVIDSMERALWKRFSIIDQQNDWMNVQRPTIAFCAESGFQFHKNDNLGPSPCSIVWCDIDDR